MGTPQDFQRGTEVSEAQIAVHWKEEEYVYIEMTKSSPLTPTERHGRPVQP